VDERYDRCPSRSFVAESVPAEAAVFLAEGRADMLSGRWFELSDDLPALVARADEIIAGDLLRMGAMR
jgi:hypothetical protein